MIISLLLLLAGQEPASSADPAAPPAASDTLPIRPVRPVLTNSEAGQAAGHAGSVFLEVDMQPDGARGPVAIVQSSRSPILDAEAVELIEEATLRPQETPVRYRVEVRFEPYDFLTTKCDSLVRQTRWFETTWPEKTIKDSVLYTGSVGMVVLAARNQGVGTVEAFQLGGRVESAWPRLVSECERRPDRLYVQTLIGLVR